MLIFLSDIILLFYQYFLRFKLKRLLESQTRRISDSAFNVLGVPAIFMSIVLSKKAMERER